MASTLVQREALPETYPDAGLSPMPDGVDEAATWQRIEAWVTYRWTPREVVWIAEGPGEWVPPLQPATVETVELWQADGYEECEVAQSPLGGLVLPHGMYRITAEVGAGPAPAAVVEAFKRLAYYIAAEAGRVDMPAASSYAVEIGEIKESWTRNPASYARAMQNSGAADALRRYRSLA